MPLLQIQTSTLNSNVSASARAGLLQTLSAELAPELGKPESYVMVSLSTDADLLFGGPPERACFASLKNIGTFSPSQTERLSREQMKIKHRGGELGR